MCMFVDRCLSFCTFSFGLCVVCSSSIYGFWLPLLYLQTLHTLSEIRRNRNCLPHASDRVLLQFVGGVRIAHLIRFLFLCLFFYMSSFKCFVPNVTCVSGCSILYCPLGGFSPTFIVKIELKIFHYIQLNA